MLRSSAVRLKTQIFPASRFPLRSLAGRPLNNLVTIRNIHRISHDSSTQNDSRGSDDIEENQDSKQDKSAEDTTKQIIKDYTLDINELLNSKPLTEKSTEELKVNSPYGKEDFLLNLDEIFDKVPAEDAFNQNKNDNSILKSLSDSYNEDTVLPFSFRKNDVDDESIMKPFSKENSHPSFGRVQESVDADDELFSSTDDTVFQSLFNEASNSSEAGENTIFLTAEDSRLTTRMSRFDRLFTESERSSEIDPIFASMDMERTINNLLVFKKDMSDENVFRTIDEMRPVENKVSTERYKQLSDDLKHFFNKQQVMLYIEERFKDDIMLNKMTARIKSSKPQLVKFLLDKLWGIKKSSKVSNSDVIVEAKVSLQNSREMFLILSSNAYFLNYWSRLGAQLFLDLEEKELVIRGNQEIVQFVEVSWNSLITYVNLIRMNLSEVLDIKKLELPIVELQLLTNVFFERISSEEELYILSCFKKSDLELVKAEIINYVNYFPHLQKQNVVDTSSTKSANGVSFKDIFKNASMPWYKTYGNPNLHRYVKEKRRLKKSSIKEFSLSEPLLKTENDDVLQASNNKIMVAEPEEHQTSRSLQEDHTKEKKLSDLIEELNTLRRDVDDAQFQFEMRNFQHNAKEVEGSPHLDPKLAPFRSFHEEYGSLVEHQVVQSWDSNSDKFFPEKIFQNLQKDGSDDKSLKRFKKLEECLPRTYSVTYGRLLFNKDEKDIDLSKNETQQQDYFFDSNLPDVNSKLSQLALEDKDMSFIGATGDIRNAFKNYLQVSLVPDVFQDVKNKHYPPAQLWLDIKGGRLDTSDVKCYGLENENSYFVSQPEFNKDLAFQGSTNSLISYDEIRETQPNLFTLINLLPSRLRLKNSEDLGKLYDYLLAHKYSISVNGKAIPYLVGDIVIKREIELQYKEHSVMYGITKSISNVQLGTQFNVTLFNNEPVESAEDFKKMYDDAKEFLKVIN